jgi:hypothetical protein
VSGAEGIDEDDIAFRLQLEVEGVVSPQVLRRERFEAAAEILNLREQNTELQARLDQREGAGAGSGGHVDTPEGEEWTTDTLLELCALYLAECPHLDDGLRGTLATARGRLAQLVEENEHLAGRVASEYGKREGWKRQFGLLWNEITELTDATDLNDYWRLKKTGQLGSARVPAGVDHTTGTHADAPEGHSHKQPEARPDGAEGGRTAREHGLD